MDDWPNRYCTVLQERWVSPSAEERKKGSLMRGCYADVNERYPTLLYPITQEAR